MSPILHTLLHIIKCYNVTIYRMYFHSFVPAAILNSFCPLPLIPITRAAILDLTSADVFRVCSLLLPHCRAVSHPLSYPILHSHFQRSPDILPSCLYQLCSGLCGILDGQITLDISASIKASSLRLDIDLSYALTMVTKQTRSR